MYVDAQLHNEGDSGISYWANTSGNDIVMNYIKQGTDEMKQEFDVLVNKGSILKKITPELTYREMNNVNHIYSFLLFTGYLKVKKVINRSDDIYEIEIPNEEVIKVYRNQFEEAFEEYKYHHKNELLHYLQEEKTIEANHVLNNILERSIRYYDNRESFYHGFLVGLFQGLEVESNKESGDGRFDVVIYPKTIMGAVIVIECKHSKSLAILIQDSELGVQQIQEKRYKEGIQTKGYQKFIGYGISFYKKQCYISKYEE